MKRDQKDIQKDIQKVIPAKKVFSSPSLIEYGPLLELTKGGGLDLYESGATSMYSFICICCGS